MENQSEPDVLFCPDCKAEIPPMAVRCWRCKKPFPRGPKAAGAIVIVRDDDEKIDAPAKDPFASAWVLLILILAVVLASILAMAPGLGIALSILALPVFISIILLVRKKQSSGQPISQPKKIGYCLVWMGIAGLMLLVIGVSIFAAFFAICASWSNNSDPTAFLIIIGIVAFFFVIGLVVLFRQTIKRL
jgi:hypothetical protein